MIRQSRSIMGMPVFLEIIDAHANQEDYEEIFNYFISVDEKFSTYKETSEISEINRGERNPEEYSEEMKEVISLSEKMFQRTGGFFNIHVPASQKNIDPSGLVKGWAIQHAAQILREKGFKDFYVEIAGDIQTNGKNSEGNEWSIGIRNPFNAAEIVKVIYPRDAGVATSGTYERGSHIYDPVHNTHPDAYVSLTVIGPNVYEADCFATAAFAMGTEGMNFLSKQEGFEAYAIDKKGIAVFTNGFEAYTLA